MQAYHSLRGWGRAGRAFAAAGLLLSVALTATAAAADPVITGLNVTQGPIGSNVIIYGSGFGSTQGSSYVTLAGNVIPATAWTDIAITALVQPPDLSTVSVGNSYPLAVVVEPANVTSNTISFSLTAPPFAPSLVLTQNDALLVERLAAAFYNQNADKAYLTVTTPVTNPGTTTPGTGVAGTAATSPTDTTAPSDSDLASLKSMVDEFRAHHAAHAALLEQAMGGNAETAPTFQNLDAPTLAQFVTMAQSIEDFAAGAQQGVLSGAIANGVTLDQTTFANLIAIAQDDARHAGALRGYRKTASAADGGDASLPVTDEGALPAARTHDELVAFVQQYLTTSTTAPTTAGQAP